MSERVNEFDIHSSQVAVVTTSVRTYDGEAFPEVLQGHYLPAS